MRVARQLGALAGLEVPALRAVETAARADGGVGLVEQREVDAEGAIRRGRAGDRLEEQIERRAGLERAHLRRHVREHGDLRRDAEPLAQLLERAGEPLDDLDAIVGGIHAEDGVAAAVAEPLERGREHAVEAVARMVRLDAGGEAAALAERGAARDHDRRACARRA